ncbi:MAG: flagellar basal body-associated FliL family protein [Sphingomonadales bacterium]|jgi:flagellar FliL protein|nr:flagellar basal body-associated FliL family protein [Sphingomonadales bacterium]MBK9004762.1 flagellar basal body-associated FliL family protein [Sphingomonadales bacterium]MBK9267511.1 flagellar basal body-associated FliL family protein [Sphingomonadales bacterium]MBP6434447.1 flagellar basal body-associated FliL family protein [Sphingorhabdus sp.]
MSKSDKDQAKTGGKKKLLLIVGGALLLAGGSAGAAIYATGGFAPKTTKEDLNRPKLVLRSEEAAEPAAEGEAAAEAPLKEGTVSVPNDRIKVDPAKYEITYFPVEQPFTANLADGSGFIQIGISLATYYDGKVIANIKRQDVPIRSAVLMALSEQDPAVLSTAQGKQMLQRELTQAINSVLRQKEGFGGIDNVYFNSLVIQ